jgi:hypothetical protein
MRRFDSRPISMVCPMRYIFQTNELNESQPCIWMLSYASCHAIFLSMS